MHGKRRSTAGSPPQRARVSWRLVGWGMGLQVLMGILVLKTGPGQALFRFANDAITGLLDFTKQGARFLFGNLALQNNVPVGPGGVPAMEVAGRPDVR